MNEGSGSTRISIRLADGAYFPIFRYGDPDTRNVSLIPASQGQSEADIQFFYHPSDGGVPQSIGVVKIPDLPLDSGEVELQLDAVIGETGLLSVSIRHIESGRVERLELTLPEERGSFSQASQTVPAVPPKKGGWLRWLVGVLFVAAGLVLVFWITMKVTHWGRQEPLPPPVSLSAPQTPQNPESAAV